MGGRPGRAGNNSFCVTRVSTLAPTSTRFACLPPLLSPSFSGKMACRHMEHLACEFHEDDKLRLEHCNDSKCTTLALFNAIAEGLRKG